jgi:hypothetical protein
MGVLLLKDKNNGRDIQASGNPDTNALYTQSVDTNGNPITGATAAKQDDQTALLTTIANASLPDKETPSMLYRVNAGQSFTGAIAGDPILGILTINTVTNTFVSNTPLWYNGRSKLPLVDADVDTSKLTVVAANSLTASELATLTIMVSAVQLISDTPSPVASSASSVTLMNANANRRSLTIFNNSSAILYVCFGATATQVGAKFAIGVGGFYEMPTGQIYTGVISGIWASANGNASIYEGV